ncbi:cell division protein anillin-domain-containing protein [Lipomyces arxii]|uniref:cell division protein anillin-domain-containing protein n=1 Tax=Lipomyces arxii TaxID=56418 RepID=UPI0034CEF0B3
MSTAGPQSILVDMAANTTLDDSNDAALQTPALPVRSSKCYINNKPRSTSNPLSDVPTHDSRRNSPSTADHRQYAQATKKPVANSELQENIEHEKILASPTVSPRTQSVISFWQDKEREVLSKPATVAKDSSPIINNRVRNSIFHQVTSSKTATPAPQYSGLSSPVLQSDEHSAEAETEQPAENETSPNIRPLSVSTEKRSSLMSSVGSFRSKKVTFEMSPPQILEFEDTHDLQTPSEDTPEEPLEDSDYEVEYTNEHEPIHPPLLEKPVSPLMKFESVFSSGVYLHRTPSGSRRLPRLPAPAARGGRPLPSVPPKQASASIPLSNDLVNVQTQALARRNSEISSTGSSYDPMELLESYVLDDIVNIDDEHILDAFDADLDAGSLTNLTDGHTLAKQPSIGEQLNRELNLEFSTSPSSRESDCADHSEVETSLVVPDTPTVEQSTPALEQTVFTPVHNAQSSRDRSPASVPSYLTSHDRTDSADSFKLELSFESPDQKSISGLGLDDYLNSTSFNDWTSKSPIVPESKQTIKTRSGLKARPSLTPGDVSRMASTRRKVSGETTHPTFIDLATVAETLPVPGTSLLGLNLNNDDFSLSDLSQELDRVMEIQQRGYLMRENTKMVYASAEQDFTDDLGSKPAYLPWTGERSPKREQTQKTELAESALPAEDMPVPSKAFTSTASLAPVSSMLIDNELTQKHTNLSTGSSVKIDSNLKPEMKAVPTTENLFDFSRDQVTRQVTEAMEPAESNDRGRLFVKVLALKDLRLPLNNDTQSLFTLTLDNGIHCVTTAYMDLSKNAPIYQEFELIVGSDLEFILTLKAKINARVAASVSRSPSPKKKESKFGLDKIFGSPKRRSVIEEAPVHSPRAMDNLLGSDGSFARSYVSFSQVQNEIYMKSKILEVPCYNEWATEFDASKSRKLARTPTAPYPIGKIVLQLLFYPKRYRNQEVPRSLNACLRELNNMEGGN